MIFKFLANNVAIMLALSLFHGMLIRKKSGHWTRTQMLSGIVFGFAAIVTMANSYQLRPGAIFDCRSVILSLTGMFAGPLPTLITAIMASAFRIWQGGVGTLTGVLVIFSTGSLGVVFFYLRRVKPYLTRPLYLYGFGVLVHFVMLALMLTFPWSIAVEVFRNITLPVIILFPIGTVLMGMLLADQEEHLANEQKIKRYSQRLTVLRDIDKNILSSLFVEDTAQTVLKYIRQLIPCERASVWVMDKEHQDWLIFAVDINHKTKITTGSHIPTLPAWNHALNEGKIIVIDNARQQKEFVFPIAQQLVEEGMRSFLHVPLVRQGQLLGSFNLFSMEKAFFTTEYQEIAQEIANQLNIALDQARLNEDIRQQNDILQQAKNQWQTTFDAINDSVCLLDPDWKIISYNHATETMLHKSADQIIGHSCYELVHGTKEPIPECPILCVKKSKHRETTVLEKDGRWLEVTADPILDSNQAISGIAHIIADVTERKKLEKQLENLVKELQTRNTELENIIYSVSHDLRSPLVNISGHTGELGYMVKQLDTLFETPPSDQTKMAKQKTFEELHQTTEIVAHSIRKMDALLKGLLKYCRLGRLPLEPEMLQMNELIDVILKSMDYIISANHIQIQIDPLPDTYADKNQMNQVFTNLIDNAIKYRNPKRQTHIHISGSNDQDHCTYTISDNGIGFSPDHADKIFEIFHRLDPSDHIPGEGLGLTIVKRIIDRHNGHICAESSPGIGTIFTITLPAYKIEPLVVL